MMQLNRAKFMVNGGIGYVLKPPPMCKGATTNRLHANKQAQIHVSLHASVSVGTNKHYCANNRLFVLTGCMEKSRHYRLIFTTK